MLIVIACGGRKRAEPCAAATMYTGTHFAATLRWARAQVSDDRIVILSAHYGIL